MVNLNAIRANVRELRQHLSPKTALLAVVKADAYGHGAIPVARVLEQEGVDWLGVAIPEEGLQLRRVGIKTPIIALGGIYHDDLRLYADHAITAVVFNAETIRRLKAPRTVRVHLKVDTGMGRLGAAPEELDDCLAAIEENRGLVLDGVMSHLANADLADDSFTARQVESFRAAVARVQSRGHRPTWIHLSNSAGTLLHHDASFTLVRPGIAVYGLHPGGHLAPTVQLQPALSLVTRIHYLKTVPAGTGISYGHQFITGRPSRIAVLPIGYADGYPRQISGKGHVLVRGQKAPIVGAVCMDMTMIDVTEVPGAAIGDETVILGQQGGEAISAQQLAEWAGTIHYDVLCGIGARVPRRWMGN